MSDIKAKASGPLWAVVKRDGNISYRAIGVRALYDDETPCRLLPGHGKWVPVELVDRIDAALNEDYCHIDERLNAVDAAIRAALEGAI